MGLCLHSRWTALLRHEMDRRLFLPYWIMAEFGGGDSLSIWTNYAHPIPKNLEINGHYLCFINLKYLLYKGKNPTFMISERKHWGNLHEIIQQQKYSKILKQVLKWRPFSVVWAIKPYFMFFNPVFFLPRGTNKYPSHLSNLWWMPQAASKRLGPAMKMVATGRFQQY